MAGLKTFDLAAARGAGIRNALGVQQFQQNALAGGGGGIDIGMVNPRDFTAESIQRARQTGNINDLVRYNAPKTPIKVDAGDAWEIYNPLNNELIKRIPKKLGPNQTPDYFSQVEGAKVEGRTGAELEVSPDIRKRKVADAEALKQVDLSYDPRKKRAEAKQAVLGANEGKKEVGKPKRVAALQAKKSQRDMLKKLTTELKSKANYWTVGFIGSNMANIKGSDAYDFGQKILTLKTNLGFDKLQDMRDNSPTGGAMGSLSEQEGAKLEAVWGSLEQAQSPAAFRDAIDRVEKQMDESWDIINDGYIAEYGVPYSDEHWATVKNTGSVNVEDLSDDELEAIINGQ